MLGSAKSEDIIRLDGKPLGDGVPTQLVKSAEWIGWPDEDDEDDQNIRVIDLGEAFFQNAVPDKIAQPASLQAPEVIFTSRFDYRLDLWRTGLLLRYYPCMHYEYSLTHITDLSSYIWSAAVPLGETGYAG